MNKFLVKIDADALQDIKSIADWYNEQLPGLGEHFQKQVKKQINSLKVNPLIYRIRYATIRCMLINKFPLLVHFSVSEKQNLVEIFAVIHTSRNPEIWLKKRK